MRKKNFAALCTAGLLSLTLTGCGGGSPSAVQLPDPGALPSANPTATPAPVPDGSPTPGPQPTATVAPNPGTPRPTATQPPPQPTATPNGTPTPPPQPTATPTATATPTPDQPSLGNLNLPKDNRIGGCPTRASVVANGLKGASAKLVTSYYDNTTTQVDTFFTTCSDTSCDFQVSFPTPRPGYEGPFAGTVTAGSLTASSTRGLILAGTTTCP